MKTARKIGCWSLVAIALLLPVVFSCGGGGGGGGGPAFAPNPASNATVMAFAAGELQGLGEGLSSVFTDLFSATAAASPATQTGLGVKSLGLTILEMAKEEALSQTGLMGIQGSTGPDPIDISGDVCISGGSATANLEWVGPNPYEGMVCTDLVDLVATMTFTSCASGGELYNGTAIVRVQGDLCNPTDFSVQFLEFTASVEGANISMADLTMSFSREGSIDSVTFDGDITANEGGQSYDMDFDGFRLDDQDFTDTTGQSWVSGFLNSNACLEDWVIFDTSEPILYDDDVNCPTGGVVNLSGGIDATVTFNEDGSIELLYDGETIDYPSCDSVPDVGGCSPPV